MFEITGDAMELILRRLEAATEGRMGLMEGTSQAGLRLDVVGRRAYLSQELPRPVDLTTIRMGRTLITVGPHNVARGARPSSRGRMGGLS